MIKKANKCHKVLKKNYQKDKYQINKQFKKLTLLIHMIIRIKIQHKIFPIMKQAFKKLSNKTQTKIFKKAKLVKVFQRINKSRYKNFSYNHNNNNKSHKGALEIQYDL